MKNKIKLLGITGLIIVISIGILYGILADSASLDDSHVFTFDIPELSFVHSGLTCYSKTESFAFYKDGSKTSAVPSNFFTANPFLNSLVDRQSNKEIDYYTVTAKTRCDLSTQKGGVIVGGFSLQPQSTITLQTKFFDYNGKEIKLQPTVQQLGNVVTLNDNTEVSLVTFKIKASDIENQLPSTSSTYNTQISFLTNVDFKFKFKDGNDSNIWQIKSNVPMSASFFQKTTKVTQASAQQTALESALPIEITSVKRTVTGENLVGSNAKNLNTATNAGRQITVLAKITEYNDKKPAPTITIFYGMKQITPPVPMTFMKYLSAKTNGDNDAEFRFLYTLPQNSPDGEYRILMKMDNRKSEVNRTFFVKNIIVQPASQTPSQTGNTITGTLPNGQTVEIEIIKQYMIMFYRVIYSSGDESGTTEKQPFPVELTPDSLVRDVSQQRLNQKFNQLQLTPQLKFPSEADLSKYSVISSDLRFDTTIKFQGEIMKLPTRIAQGFYQTSSSCIKATDGSSVCNNAGLPLGTYIIEKSAIEQALRNTQKFESLPMDSKVPVEVLVDVKGDFGVKHIQTGKTYTGKAEGANFKLSMSYIRDGKDSGGLDLKCEEGFFLKAFSGGDLKCVQDKNPTQGEEPETGTGSSDGGFFGGLFNDNNSNSAPHCDTDSQGRVIATYGAVTKSSENCQNLDIGVSEQVCGTGVCQQGSQQAESSMEVDKKSGNNGIGVICSGDSIQCASALTDAVNDFNADPSGFFNQNMLIILGVIAFFLLITIIIIISRRK